MIYSFDGDTAGFWCPRFKEAKDDCSHARDTLGLLWRRAQINLSPISSFSLHVRPGDYQHWSTGNVDGRSWRGGSVWHAVCGFDFVSPWDSIDMGFCLRAKGYLYHMVQWLSIPAFFFLSMSFQYIYLRHAPKGPTRFFVRCRRNCTCSRAQTAKQISGLSYTGLM